MERHGYVGWRCSEKRGAKPILSFEDQILQLCIDCETSSINLGDIFGTLRINVNPVHRNVILSNGILSNSSFDQLERLLNSLASIQLIQSPFVSQLLSTFHLHGISSSSPLDQEACRLLVELMTSATELTHKSALLLEVLGFNSGFECVFCNSQAMEQDLLWAEFSASPRLAFSLHAFLIHYPVIIDLLNETEDGETLGEFLMEGHDLKNALVRQRAEETMERLILSSTKLHHLDCTKLAVGMSPSWRETSFYSAFCSPFAIHPTVGLADESMLKCWKNRGQPKPDFSTKLMVTNDAEGKSDTIPFISSPQQLLRSSSDHSPHPLAEIEQLLRDIHVPPPISVRTFPQFSPISDQASPFSVSPDFSHVWQPPSPSPPMFFQ